MPIQQVGRLGKVFIKTQADFDTPATFGATDAFRHNTLTLGKSLNRENSREKRGTPGVANRFSRHTAASFNLTEAYLMSSGTNGVVPEADPILLSGLGATEVNSHTSTVAANPTATGADLTAVTGLTVGGVITVQVGTAYHVRRVSAIAANTVTWAPALPAAPSVGGVTRGGVIYRFANDLPSVLTIGRYLPNRNWQAEGAVVDQLGLRFDNNGEVMLSASGPAKDRTAAQAQPGAFTTTGSPVTGITGGFWVDTVAFPITGLDVAIANTAQLINDTLGTSVATGFFRDGQRTVSLTINCRLTEDDTLEALAEAASDGVLMAQAGNTLGGIIGVYFPRAEFDIPEIPDGDGGLAHSYTGLAKENAGNDEAYVLFG